MPETIVTRHGRGLPYSKGLMAQSLSATGLSLERSFELARAIERRLAELGEESIDVTRLRALTEEVLRVEEGERAVRRFHAWQRLDRLDRPLVVMLGGTTGVGKSTLATMLAHRLGITRVVATDAIRQVLRSFFARDFMPAVHQSAFEAGNALDEAARAGLAEDDVHIVGYAQQAEAVATGVAAIVERACEEGTPIVVEGVHVVPGTLDPPLRERCVPVEALVVVRDEALHRGHFSLRSGDSRPAQRYLESFDRIRALQSHLEDCAATAGVPVIDNEQLDAALVEAMDLILESASRVTSSEAG